MAHVFDLQGRPTSLITWQNFTARTGAAATTWNYDPTNGLLRSKVYADGKGTTNTYTPGKGSEMTNGVFESPKKGSVKTIERVGPTIDNSAQSKRS